MAKLKFSKTTIARAKAAASKARAAKKKASHQVVGGKASRAET
jgi:hypothetical protein